MQSLLGKTAVVTGAAQGIGRAIALRLARDGAQVALVDRAAEQCARVHDEIKAGRGSAIVIAADLETKAGTDHMVERAIDAFGTIDIAINNVGGTIWIKPFWEYSDEEIQQEISRSLWTTLRCCRGVIPIMLKQKQGAIINIGSIATREIYRVPYSAAKGGVHAMTICMSMELAKFNIRVNCIAPGSVEQPERLVGRNAGRTSAQDLRWQKEVRQQNPLGDIYLARRGKAEEVAATAAFLASEEASHITGQILFTAGGRVG
jgi:dihydroxycyclohexadiene carboxylate dehydrogenase